jgi:hypothetical protein
MFFPPSRSGVSPTAGGTCGRDARAPSLRSVSCPRSLNGSRAIRMILSPATLPVQRVICFPGSARRTAPLLVCHLERAARENVMKNCHGPRGRGDWSNSFYFNTARFVTTGFSTLRLSDWEDIQSWVQGIVTRWEKQRGPIPNTELLPHEIGRGWRRWRWSLKRKPECFRK